MTCVGPSQYKYALHKYIEGFHRVAYILEMQVRLWVQILFFSCLFWKPNSSLIQRFRGWREAFIWLGDCLLLESAISLNMGHTRTQNIRFLKFDILKLNHSKIAGVPCLKNFLSVEQTDKRVTFCKSLSMSCQQEWIYILAWWACLSFHST